MFLNSIGIKMFALLTTALLAVGLLGTFGFGAERGAGAFGIIVAVAIVVSLACGWLLRRQIVRPIREAVRVAEAVAAGDLSVETRYASSDEFGELHEALRRLRRELADSVASIRRTAEGVRTASGAIARGNADLSNRMQQQAANLEETSSSMEELTSTVKQNASNAAQANQLAAGASEVASRGGDAVRGVVNTMSGITESSKKISDIIGVIDGIAFQTNILALNAAVEAARAGEQGRGFAVVASEVRSLAGRSAEAAKQIKTLIQESVGRVGAGTKQVEAAGKTMDELLAAVKRVTDIMGEIAAASTEQLSGIEQVSQVVMQMDQVVQQNAALVEQNETATGNLATQSASMTDAVSRFRTGQAEAHASPAVRAPAARPAAAAPKAAPKLAPTPAPAPAPAPAREPAPRAARPSPLPKGAPEFKPGSAAAADGEWKEI
ncbi:MAG TPA: methyl-accepting chemotaxis protein [Burkholderiales bacterium]|nr:methyl-accepting chemotaxis protein [Burkholderiales bacterium]